jgi:3-keto-5-aminohexanoate cleavage enzyme
VSGLAERPGWQPLILSVAPNGARKTKADHPQLPISPAELAATARAAAEAGAAMIHLHVRDEQGAHTLDPGAYRAAIEAIRAELGDAIIIQATSEAAGRYGPEQQIEAMRALRPEAVSLAIRELVPDQEREAAAAAFLEWLVGEGVLVQYILYSDDDVRRFDRLLERRVIPERPLFLLFVLGRYSAGQRSDPGDLLPFLAVEQGRRNWAVCAFGEKENACATAAAALGGHVRVGFENNLLLPDGRSAPDNAALVAAAASAASVIGRPLADVAEARQIMAAGAA